MTRLHDCSTALAVETGAVPVRTGFEKHDVLTAPDGFYGPRTKAGRQAKPDDPGGRSSSSAAATGTATSTGRCTSGSKGPLGDDPGRMQRTRWAGSKSQDPPGVWPLPPAGGAHADGKPRDGRHRARHDAHAQPRGLPRVSGRRGSAAVRCNLVNDRHPHSGTWNRSQSRLTVWTAGLSRSATNAFTECSHSVGSAVLGRP